MKADSTVKNDKSRYNVIVDIVGFRPSYKASKGRIAKATKELRTSLERLGIISDGRNDPWMEKLHDSPLIMFILQDNMIVAMTRDTSDASLVHLFGSMMNIELTLMSSGIPIRGILFKEHSRPIHQIDDWAECSIEDATKLCDSLRIFGVFLVKEEKNNGRTTPAPKRTKEDIPLEYPTLVPTSNGLRRLSKVNWCCFFRNYLEVEEKINEIKPKKESFEYLEFLNSTREVLKEAHDNTWNYDDGSLSLPLPFTDN